jgi:1-acyl-sn-glycerol-3-phosphate acyltransferase
MLLLYDFLFRVIYVFGGRARAERFVDWVLTWMPRLAFRALNVGFGFRFTLDRGSLKKLPERFVMISNHQSLVDIPALMAFCPERRLRFVAKDSLGAGIPYISQVLKYQRHALIQRKGGMSATMITMGKFARRSVSENFVPVIFPEGTRSVDGRVKTFYSAGFRVLSDAVQEPIVAVAVDGGYLMRDFRDLFTSLRTAFYRVKVVGVYPAPSGKEATLKTLSEAESAIRAQVEEWHSA